MPETDGAQTHRLVLTGPNQERAAEGAQALIETIRAAGPDGFAAEVEASWRMARGQSRWVVAGRHRAELLTALAEFVLDGSCIASGQHRSGPRRTTFVFSGMGPQWAGMGRSLADALPGFGDRIDEVDKLLAEHYGRSVWAELAHYDATDQLPTALAQPGNFLLQAALHDLLVADGVRPEAIIGHSAGEVAAAYAAGVYDLAEAARVAVVRGRLQARLAGRGAMLAIGLGQAEAEAMIAEFDGISLAAVNDRQAVTVAGDADQIARLEERLRGEQVFAKALRVEVPYHSPVMDEIADELRIEMRFIIPKPAMVPLYSTVSGLRSTGEEWGASYWPINVRQPVLFAAAVEQAIAEGTRTFVEVAPHPVLSQSITSLAPRDEGITVAPLLSRRDDEYRFFLGALGQLALEGVGRPRRVRSAPLPRPVRAPQRLWDQDPWYDSDRANSLAVPGVPLLGRRVADHGDEFQVELSLGDQPWIAGHEVQGLGPVVPATMWAELLALAATVGDERSVSLTDLTIVQGLPVQANPTIVRMEVAGGTVRCSSRPVGDPSSWALNAVASIGPSVPDAMPEPADRAPSGHPAGGSVLDAEALYALFRLKGLRYSDDFHNLRDVQVDGSAGLVAWATIEAARPFTSGHRAPWVLDAGLQLLIAAASDLGEAMFLPQRIGRVVLHRPIRQGTYRARAEVSSRTGHELVGSIRYLDADGVPVAELADVVCARNHSDDASRSLHVNRHTYTLHPVTPREIVERFGPDEDLDDLDDLGFASEVDEVPPSLELDPADEPALRLDESWIGAAATVPLGLAERPVVELDSVPRGERRHLLWTVPRGGRDDAAIATFDLVNRVAALDDPTLVLTLIGQPDQFWLLGLRRSASNAFGFPVRAVLADDTTSPDELDHWIAEIDEYEVHLGDEATLSRLEQRSAADLRAVALDEQGDGPGPGTTLVYDLPSARALDVAIETVAAPGPGEVTIENLAVPLTWKDVGKVFGSIGAAALGTFAGRHLGLGAVGRVVAVGPDTPFVVGDLVGGPVRRPFRQRLTIDAEAEYLRPMSDDVDPVVQLTLMMPWVTALAALDDVGRIRHGDLVFVQSGAGALGSVLCRHAIDNGCRVVTSVGTEDKVAAVRQLFGDRVEVVVARGADVAGAVLAAGHGPFDCIAANINGAGRALLLAQLRGGGRYVDLGKPAGPDEVQLSGSLDGNRILARIDTDQIAATDRAWFGDLISRAMAKVADPANHTPVTRYPVADLPQAIADLSRGDTVGSLAVDLVPTPTLDHVRRTASPMDPEGIYLITGGYGGVGLMIAQWLVSRGARTVVLTGRSGEMPDRGRASIELMTAFGADVWVLAADVADPACTAELLAELRADRPIRGIVHAAGVIADGPFTEIDDDRIRRSFGPKLGGADNLVAGLDLLDGAWDDLEFLLLTSSMSGALGVSLQGTYAAANTGLDGLAQRLGRRGVRACALQLGPIAEGGMAADDERNERFFAANGLSMVSPRQLYGVLDLALAADAPVLMTAEIDWQRVGRSEPGNARSSVIGHLVAAASAGGDGAGLEQLLALSRDDRTEVLALTLLGLFAEALGIADDSLAADTSFADMGIDSLAVVEIQVGISEILQHEVPMARLFLPDGNIGQLAARMSEYLDEVLVGGEVTAGGDGVAGGDVTAGQGAQAEVANHG